MVLSGVKRAMLKHRRIADRAASNLEARSRRFGHSDACQGAYESADRAACNLTSGSVMGRL